MTAITVSDAFDSGRIELFKAEQADDIQLRIDADSNADFRQWFHCSIQGIYAEDCKIRFVNASECSYVEGWEGYNVCASYDRDEWFRVPTRYENGELIAEFTAEQDRIYLAYFTPYSQERHLSLLARAQASGLVELTTLGQTVDGRDMDRLIISAVPADQRASLKQIWVIGRQHPGETMAEWFIEGMLGALLDEDHSMSSSLLRQAVFHVVPNMNPDGSARGNLRTNAAGANLNREWMEPSMAQSPEVYLVRQAMQQTGIDLFLDIHGDEGLPYNFVAGCEGNPSYTDTLAALESRFKTAWQRVCPDFQDVHGYDKDEPGKADLRIATNYIGEHFGCLAYTVEMPFKDNRDWPDEMFGWSSERCQLFGESVLMPIHEVLPETVNKRG